LDEVFIPYIDEDLKKNKIDLDAIYMPSITEKEELVPETPEDFNISEFFDLTRFLVVDDGWYYGTLHGGVPHNYGKIVFKSQINNHQLKSDSSDSRMLVNYYQCVFYQGAFMHGEPHG